MRGAGRARQLRSRRSPPTWHSVAGRRAFRTYTLAGNTRVPIPLKQCVTFTKKSELRRLEQREDDVIWKIQERRAASFVWGPGGWAATGAIFGLCAILHQSRPIQAGPVVEDRYAASEARGPVSRAAVVHCGGHA